MLFNEVGNLTLFFAFQNRIAGTVDLPIPPEPSRRES